MRSPHEETEGKGTDRPRERRREPKSGRRGSNDRVGPGAQRCAGTRFDPSLDVTRTPSSPSHVIPFGSREGIGTLSFPFSLPFRPNPSSPVSFFLRFFFYVLFFLRIPVVPPRFGRDTDGAAAMQPLVQRRGTHRSKGKEIRFGRKGTRRDAGRSLVRASQVRFSRDGEGKRRKEGSGITFRIDRRATGPGSSLLGRGSLSDDVSRLIGDGTHGEKLTRNAFHLPGAGTGSHERTGRFREDPLHLATGGEAIGLRLDSRDLSLRRFEAGEKCWTGWFHRRRSCRHGRSVGRCQGFRRQEERNCGQGGVQPVRRWEQSGVDHTRASGSHRHQVWRGYLPDLWGGTEAAV